MTEKMVLNSNFVELNNDETMQVEGGGWPVVVGLVILGLFVAGSLKGCSDADHGK